MSIINGSKLSGDLFLGAQDQTEVNSVIEWIDYQNTKTKVILNKISLKVLVVGNLIRIKE